MQRMRLKAASLPDTPGVYIFKDAAGRVIYIGKAKSLKKRLQSYFRRQLDSKTQAMLSRAAELDYLTAPTEAQAQILEASLIKQRQPQYNIDLKDDKSFPWIRIGNEEFPSLSICRKRKSDREPGVLYFGPYTNAKLLRQALKIIRRIFGFRSCRKIPAKACLYHRVKLCPAPCIGRIDKDAYREIIGRIKMFLESRHARLLDELSRKMKSASQERRFEEAARLRDQLNALSALAVSENMNELEELKDLLGLERLPLRIEAFDISNISGREACGSLVSFSAGTADKDNYRRFRIKTVKGIDDYKMLAEVLRRRYRRMLREKKAALPDLILIDGGRGHLLTAKRTLAELGIALPLISIAKGEENIYIKDSLKALKLEGQSAALNLIRRIRDEAHRFAVSYHHILRRKEVLGR